MTHPVKQFGYGKRLVVPPLAEAWAWWRAVTRAADPYLDSLDGADLTRWWKSESSRETPGTKLHRTGSTSANRKRSGSSSGTRGYPRSSGASVHLSTGRKACRASHGPLEPVLARLVEVVGQDALARPLKAHPLVEAMGLIEARVGPEDQPSDVLRAAPVEHRLDEGTAGAAAAQARIEIEAMKLGAAVGQPLDAG